MQIAITGANSAVGTALLRHVAGREELRAVAAVRRPEALADLPSSPRITGRLLDYGRPETLRDVLAGAGCVVHLAGVLFESRRTSYQSGNVDTTRALVDAALEAGMPRIVFVSSLGADRARRTATTGPRARRRTWQRGPGSTPPSSVRRCCSALKRPADAPCCATRRALRSGCWAAARTCCGRSTSRTCGSAILHCCAQPAGGVRTYELVGPTALSQRDLLQRTARLLGNDLTVGTMPIGVAKLAARCAGLLRSGGLTSAVIDVITAAETVRRNADADLGIELTPLADTLERLVEASRR